LTSRCTDNILTDLSKKRVVALAIIFIILFCGGEERNEYRRTRQSDGTTIFVRPHDSAKTGVGVWKPDSRGCSKVVRPSITSSDTLIVNELLYSIFVVVVVFTCCDWLYGALGQSRVKIIRDHRDRKYYNNAAVVMYIQVVLYIIHCRSVIGLM